MTTNRYDSSYIYNSQQQATNAVEADSFLNYCYDKLFYNLNYFYHFYLVLIQVKIINIKFNVTLHQEGMKQLPTRNCNVSPHTLIRHMCTYAHANHHTYVTRTSQGYYMRSDEYLPIRNREKKGTFPVVLIHSAMLIDLTNSQSRSLKFYPPSKNYPYRVDDFVVQLYNALMAGLYMVVMRRTMLVLVVEVWWWWCSLNVN